MLPECCQPRHVKLGRWGLAEDPVGAIVVDRSGRLYNVTGTYRREVPAGIMLQLRHFNGETAEDMSCSAVKILPRCYHDERSS